jgi:hypothetical protein
MFAFFVHVYKWVFHQHFHLAKLAALRVGLPFSSFIGPLTPDILAQKDFFLDPPSGCGAFKLDPVAALYFALPLAVSPAPLDTGSFSPLPIAREGAFLVAIMQHPF